MKLVPVLARNEPANSHLAGIPVCFVKVKPPRIIKIKHYLLNQVLVIIITFFVGHYMITSNCHWLWSTGIGLNLL